MDQKHRFLYLDGIRGISAVVLTICHFGDRTPQGILLKHGYLAVDFFFLLSGFVLCYAYERKLAAGMTWAGFLQRRVVRLYPLYLLGLVLGSATVFAMGQLTGHDLSTFAEALVFALFLIPFPHTVHYTLDAFPLNGPAWALSYELAINLVYAMVGFARSNRGLLTIIMVSFVFYSVSAAVYGTYLVGPSVGQAWGGLLRTSYSFFLGVLIFRLSDLGKPVPKWTWWVATLIFYGCLAAPRMVAGNRPLDAVILTVVLPSVLFFGARCEVPKVLERFCEASGELAFPIYMLHFPVVELASRYSNAHHLADGPAFAVMLAATALIVVLSWVVVKFYDAPVRAWLNGMIYARRGADPAASRSGGVGA